MNKKYFYSLLALTFIGNSCVFSQTVNTKSTSKYTKCSKFYISKPLRDLPSAKYVKDGDKREALDRLAEQYEKLVPKPKHGKAQPDPVVQGEMGQVILDSLLVNFDGIPNALDPPDPTGAIGPNYFMQADNINIAVYKRNGDTAMGPRDLGYLWDSNEVGDPIVLYDKFVDRWFVSQLELDMYGNWLLAAAVSTTNDPTGTYYVYYFPMVFNGFMPDYPKYSIWTDGYYCTERAFGGPEQIFVLERNRMLKGDPSAGMISDTLPTSHPFSGDNRLTNAPKVLDCDGALPPYGTPNYLFFFENITSGGPSNSIVIYKLVTDTTLKTVTPTVYDSLPTAWFNAYFNGAGSYDNISQPGATFSIDDLDGSFNYRVPYIRFTGYNSVVLCNTVNMGGLVAGIRWYELRQNDTTKKFSIYQQGTYAPYDGVSRWNSSISMNSNGDISLAFTVSDSVSVYPGIRYTGRMANDPLGQMTFAEQTAVSGITSWGGGRWGDYSQTTVDPNDGLTFWHTNEYMGDSNNERTRIFSFKLNAKPNPSAVQSLPQTKPGLVVYQSDGMLNIVATSLPNDENTVVNLFDINGKQLTSEWVKPQSGKIENKINVSNLASGTYLVRVGNAKFQLVKKVIIN